MEVGGEKKTEESQWKKGRKEGRQEIIRKTRVMGILQGQRIVLRKGYTESLEY